MILRKIFTLMKKLPVWTVTKLISLGLFLLETIDNAIESLVFRITRRSVKHNPSEFDLQYSDISFLSDDGLTMRGWWFETAPEKPAIIFLHGVGANRAEPAERVFGIAEELLSCGYNVLAFDYRAHGESEGKHTSAGYYEKNDLLGAIKFVRRQGVTGKIGLLGFSMGAAISLMTAAESQDVSAVVADSAYGDVMSIIEEAFSKRKYLPKFLIPFVLSITKILYKFDFTWVSPVESLKLIDVPVFIIHGALDTVVPVEHAYRLSKACRNLMSQLWVVPEATHTSAYSIRTQEYIIRMLSFFKNAFALNTETLPTGLAVNRKLTEVTIRS
jgi:uncharacterized protein